MPKLSKKKFSINQVVVFRIGAKNLVGKVSFIRLIGKNFEYEVLCEDGKIYTELSVDSEVNHTIDTKLTKMFYAKYGMTHTSIPDNSITTIDDMEINTSTLDNLDMEVVEDSDVKIPLYELEDYDENY